MKSDDIFCKTERDPGKGDFEYINEPFFGIKVVFNEKFNERDLA